MIDPLVFRLRNKMLFILTFPKSGALAALLNYESVFKPVTEFVSRDFHPRKNFLRCRQENRSVRKAEGSVPAIGENIFATGEILQ
jgi:hypothetical protein